MKDIHAIVRAKLEQARKTKAPAITLAKILARERFGKNTDAIREAIREAAAKKDYILELAVAEDYIAGKQGAIDIITHDVVNRGSHYIRFQRPKPHPAVAHDAKVDPPTASMTTIKRDSRPEEMVPPPKVATMGYHINDLANDFGLSTRTYNVLAAAEMDLVENLVMADVVQLKGFGPKAVADLNSALDKAGITLAA